MFNEPTLTRRAFVKAGGTLVVSLGVPATFGVRSAEAATVDPTRLASWIELKADDTIIARTGRTETGTGMSAFYAQMVAEELRVRPEAITLVMGHTDETPDGGFSAGFLSGSTNLKRVAAYTYQALLGLASQRLGVPVGSLTVVNGVVSAEGRSITYGELVRGQHLDLTIPVRGALPRIDDKENTGVANLPGYTVTGEPPMRSPTEYTVIGTSFPMPGTKGKITGTSEWTGDVRLPGMLHARMIRPASLGSTLLTPGRVDRRRFPNAEVVRKGNLLAVVSPDEWEAVTAARAVAGQTKWSAWSGLPGSDGLIKALRAYKWGAPTGTRGNADNVAAGLASAVTTVAAAYEQPYVRHAPIGPYVAVADVRPDGKVTIWTHSSQSQGLRAQIAHALGTSTDNVVVRWTEGAGQYGRTTYGGDGAEGDAAILSQLLGKPVRVQWTLQEDLAWSTASPAWVADAKAGLDKSGNITALRYDWYSPNENDARLLGAILAGAPSASPKPFNPISTQWPYDKVPAVLEQAYAMPNIGAGKTSAGVRGNIMRTPWQRQQNFVLETLMNQAAAAAGVDPIEYRIRHTSNDRLIAAMRAAADAHGWHPRPSPASDARRSGPAPVKGRGIAVIIRQGAFWAGLADIEVSPGSGRIQVTRFTVAVELGKVINPLQLERVIQGGIVQGLGEALKEEVTFDTSKVTSTDWGRYRIMTMQETPEIKVVQMSRDDVGFGTGGEAPNALPPAVVAAAFFDATGVWPHRIPLTPTYVRSLLKA